MAPSAYTILSLITKSAHDSAQGQFAINTFSLSSRLSLSRYRLYVPPILFVSIMADSEVTVAVAALVIAFSALVIACGQLLQQLFNTADGLRRCRKSVIGGWSQLVQLRFHWCGSLLFSLMRRA
jgi:hypothetical protein